MKVQEKPNDLKFSGYDFPCMRTGYRKKSKLNQLGERRNQEIFIRHER